MPAIRSGIPASASVFRGITTEARWPANDAGDHSRLGKLAHISLMNTLVTLLTGESKL